MTEIPGADINAKDEYGRTALTFATANGYHDTEQILKSTDTMQKSALIQEVHKEVLGKMRRKY